MRKITFRVLWLILFIAFSPLYSQDVAQTVVDFEEVDNPSNATAVNNSYAQINSYGGIAVGINSFNGYLELEFSDVISAGVPTYIRLDSDIELLSALVQGSLGDLISDLVGNIALGDHYFTISAKLNDNVVDSYSTETYPLSNGFNVVVDNEGNYFATINPTQQYNRVRISDHTDALLIGERNYTRVFYAISDLATIQGCYKPQFTSADASGISLDALDLGNAGVSNPENAIDEDPSTFSQISHGTAGVASSISQIFYTGQVVPSGDGFGVSLSTDGSLVSAGIAENIEIIAYLNDSQVYTTSAGALLDVELLT